MKVENKCPPVLLVSFRRPDLTKKMLENIAAANPPAVYVACDGPRTNKVGEAEMVEEVHRVVNSFSDRLNLICHFNKENKGCARNMSESITWFLDQAGEGIILEDDCYPDQSFYPFCAELLERYRNDTRVMQISGYNYYEKAPIPLEHDYFFSYIGWQWGWATWKRAWDKFDVHVSDWPEFKARNLHKSPPFLPLRNEHLDDLISNGNAIDSWAYPWQGVMAMNNGLSVVPIKSLVVNIGHGYGCTHGEECGSAVKYGSDAHTMKFPLNHPKFIVADVMYDDYIKEYRRMTLYKKVRRCCGNVLRRLGLRK